MWGKIVIGVLVFFIIIIIIKRRKNKKMYEQGDIWDEVSKVERGACAKLKELLWGC